ncbi:MAG: hypothetical protein RRZ24_00770 [Clostridia bacterium]
MLNAKRLRVKRVAQVLPKQSDVEHIPSDVLGSYTGCAMDGDRPIQDADDL